MKWVYECILSIVKYQYFTIIDKIYIYPERIFKNGQTLLPKINKYKTEKFYFDLTLCSIFCYTILLLSLNFYEIIFLIFEMQNFKTSILAKKVQIDQKTNEKFNCFSKKKNSDLNSEKFYPQIAQRISNSN